MPEEQLCSPTATSITIDARFLIEALKHGDIAISQAGDRYEIQVPEFDMPMDENSIDGSPGKGTDNEMEFEAFWYFSSKNAPNIRENTILLLGKTEPILLT